MKIVDYEPSHLDDVEPGRIERGSPHLEAFRAALESHGGPAYSLADGGEILGCAGILESGGEGWTWVWLSDQARTRPVGLTRAIRALSRRHAADYEALYGMVRKGLESEARWLRLCGYRDDGTMKLPDADYMRFRYGH